MCVCVCVCVCVCSLTSTGFLHEIHHICYWLRAFPLKYDRTAENKLLQTTLNPLCNPADLHVNILKDLQRYSSHKNENSVIIHTFSCQLKLMSVFPIGAK